MTPFFKPRLVWLALLLVSGISRAELLPAYDLETAETLPKGVSSPRFRALFSSTTTAYDGLGVTLPLGATLSRAVTWKDVLGAQDGEAERASIRSILTTGQAIPESDTAGEVRTQINTFTSASVPILMMGLSDVLTVGVAVPVVKVDAQVDSGFVSTSSAQTVIDRACSASSPVKCAESASRLNRAIPHRLESLGYEPLQSRSLTAVGDIRLIGKYSLLANSESQLTLKPVVLLPTGRTANPDDVLGLKTGDGRYALTMTAIFDRQNVVVPHLKFTAYSGYTMFLPDSPEVRVPTLESSLSADKERVNRGVSHGAFVGGGLKYAVPALGMFVGSGYHFQYLGPSPISGSRFSDERYARLRDLNPERWLHNATALLGFSTVAWYRKNLFFVPLELSVSWNRPVGGRNAWSNDLWAGEFILYL